MKTEKWLIIIDLDGTFLMSDGKTVHKYNKIVIKKLIELGCIVCIATGRSWRETKKTYNDIKLTTSVVNFNGGIIHNPYNKEKFETQYKKLKPSIIKKVLNLDIVLESKKNIIVEHPLGRFFENPNVTTESHEEGKKHKLTNKIFNSHSYTIIIETMAVANSIEVMNKIKTEIPEVICRVWSRPSNEDMIEINPQGSHKGNGIRELAKHYNIPIKNVIAFGDGDNDVEMLQIAGVGVAMKNARSEIKECANDVTKFSNEEAGVGKYLNEFFKLKIE